MLFRILGDHKLLLCWHLSLSTSPYVIERNCSTISWHFWPYVYGVTFILRLPSGLHLCDSFLLSVISIPSLRWRARWYDL